ncbi:hypothetical protein GH714_042206 [Hevea brasiliensis]|uniref:ACB domain-containing protein n=1 Tax=Hevea brasiliensis TaxID=3981 RepID=A0A6A6MWB7_HEVBR|nr:hypothetical protein GH714_042206 [Hevea brasiliensis]
MAMARASSGLAYPDRFYAAAAYAGFDGSPNSANSVSSKFQNDTALLLYALYQQALLSRCFIAKLAKNLIFQIREGNCGPCNTPKPSTWNAVEQSKWKSWNGLANMPPTEAMRLFVKILEEEDPGWYSRASNFVSEPVLDIQTNVLDLRSWTWSKVDAKAGAESDESKSLATVTSCAGHSLIAWENKLLSIAGHTKDHSESIQVKAFDPQTRIWLTLKTYGKAPVSRGGQSVTLVGTSLVIFGGQDGKRSLLNDLHILDLETMTWDEIDAVGVPPSPRSDHAAAVHAERYLLIFGGGSHATCFSDLHVLDLQAMEWTRPTQQGEIPSPRAGHAGVTVGENWFIVGGGNNKSGVSETVVLNMSTLVWSVVTSVKGRVPIASEGLSLAVSSYNGEDILVSFGGYNGRYSNEVNVIKPSHKSTLQSKIVETSVPDSVSAVHNVTNATRDLELEFEAGQEGKIREIVMDNVDPEPMKSKSEVSSEHLIATLKAEKEELESSLSKEKLQTVQLKQELVEAENRNTDLYKELQSVRGQLAAEQSRCFKLEVDVAEQRQKLQTMETLQKELELLQRQKAASEQAALNAKHGQASGGMWGWLAGTPGGQREDEA